MIRDQVAHILRNARRDQSIITIDRDTDRTYTFLHGAYSYKIVTQRRRNVYVYRRKNYADGTYDVDIFKSRRFCCVDDEKISNES